MTLDELEKLWFAPSVIPFETPLNENGLQHGLLDGRFRCVLDRVNLDGNWEMLGAEETDWAKAIRADIPCTVYVPLMRAGLLPDLYKEKNVELARAACFRSWRFRKCFTLKNTMEHAVLSFEGVANECTVWLDGELLGRHAGAFGGPDFELDGLTAGEHLLEVLLDAIPDEPYMPEDGSDDFRCHEPHVRREFYTMVTPLINYGHHYVNLPSHGIWRSVYLKETMPAKLNVLAGAKNLANARRGIVDLFVTVEGMTPGAECTLNGEITPWNFEGKPLHFENLVSAQTQKGQFHLQVTVPDAKMWWPKGYGEPNLYNLRLRFDDERGAQGYYETRFGIRTVEMEETASRFRPINWYYAWRFVINGVPMPIHGQNWGMLDSTNEKTEADYARMLKLAEREHCNMLRVWGNGVIEISKFYEMCDEMGMMVFQEWPLSACSHYTRKLQLMHDTVVRNMLVLRNHPSIVLWCGGNELNYQKHQPTHNGIRMLGRIAYELDGTRPFHISEDWGGSFHEYPVFWGGKELEGQLSTKSIFLGEFGLAATPCYESVLHYLPEAEKIAWPPEKGSVMRYHTPMFDNSDDYERIARYAAEMMPLDSLEHFCLGSQLGQVVAIRHSCEYQRCGWPNDCTGVLHYKLNEMYPSISWGTVDCYSVPRMAHYFIENTYRPQHACLLMNTFKVRGKAAEWPVHVLDDQMVLKKAEWHVDVKAYDASLRLIKEQTYSGAELMGQNTRIGTFALDAEQTDTAPLMLYVRLTTPQGSSSTFYWLNFKDNPGGLMKLPRTELSAAWSSDYVTIRNTGRYPAVGVHFEGWEALRHGFVEDSFFWMEPGEERTLTIENPENHPLRLECWNADGK